MAAALAAALANSAREITFCEESVCPILRGGGERVMREGPGRCARGSPGALRAGKRAVREGRGRRAFGGPQPFCFGKHNAREG